jgi:hypothetical protein
MHEQSRQNFGADCQSTGSQSAGDWNSPDATRCRGASAVRLRRRGYYTYRAGEGIVFVPYGLSAAAK